MNRLLIFGFGYTGQALARLIPGDTPAWAMAFVPGKKTKTGYSTDAATLEKLRDEWPEFIEPLLSYREVEKLLSRLKVKSFASRDEQEVAGYAQVMDVVFNAWQDIPFNENHIKQLHQILLRHSEKDARHRGQYKTHSNSVAAFDENGTQIGIVFETATPFDTPRLMTELVFWVNGEREKAHLHPLLIIANFVVVFLEIHPFQDGNGRLSRVLTTLLLIQAGYAYVPYSSLESVIELNKEAYYLALRQTQGTIRMEAPNWQPWLVFFLRSLAEQVRRLEKKVEREKIVLATLPELSLKIVEFAREHERVTMMDAITVPISGIRAKRNAKNANSSDCFPPIRFSMMNAKTPFRAAKAI